MKSYGSESERRPTKTVSQRMSAMGCLIKKEWMKPHSNHQKPPHFCRSWFSQGTLNVLMSAQAETNMEGSKQSRVSAPVTFFLPEVPDSLTRTGLLLDMLLTGRKELFGNMVVEGSLSCSDHQWQSLNAEEKWERQEAEEKSGLQVSRLWFIWGRQEAVLMWEGAQKWPLIYKDKLFNALEGSSPLCKSQASLAEDWLSWTRKFSLNSTMKT